MLYKTDIFCLFYYRNCIRLVKLLGYYVKNSYSFELQFKTWYNEAYCQKRTNHCPKLTCFALLHVWNHINCSTVLTNICSLPVYVLNIFKYTTCMLNQRCQCDNTKTGYHKQIRYSSVQNWHQLPIYRKKWHQIQAHKTQYSMVAQYKIK